VALNCAALPESLLESELFGHEKGAFSGAVAARKGKFEQADGGTLLLDEIGEMDPRLQAKLLRAIQEREVDRLGGARRCRWMCAAGRHQPRPAAEVRRGRFREDLFFRLNVVAPHSRRCASGRRHRAAGAHFARRFARGQRACRAPLSPRPRRCCWRIPGRAMCGSWRTPAPRRAAGRGPAIGPEAIELTPPPAAPARPAPRPAPRRRPPRAVAGLVGRRSRRWSAT
jgi:hypothetical protein